MNFLYNPANAGRQMGLVGRQSPVFWGEKGLRGETRRNFEEAGYLVEGRKDPWPSLELREVGGVLRGILESPAPGRIFERDGKTTRSQFDIHRRFPKLLKLALTREMLECAEAILGGEALIYQTHVNFKPPYVGGAYDWHSDYAYWRDHDGMLEPRALSLVIPLGAHDQGNGGLQVFKGSHRFFYPTELKHRDRWSLEEVLHDPAEGEKENGLVPKALRPKDSSSLVISPGLGPNQFLIMDANLWHYSASNFSSIGRPTLFVVVITKETPFDESKRGYRPAYISCREGYQLGEFLK